jgi:hypothetical protein
MNTFEFQAKPMNGCIQIPAEYEEKITGTVRVIVISNDQSLGPTDMIDRLLAAPLDIENFTPMNRAEVYERR